MALGIGAGWEMLGYGGPARVGDGYGGKVHRWIGYVDGGVPSSRGLRD